MAELGCFASTPLQERVLLGMQKVSEVKTNSHFLQYNALGVRGASKRVGLQCRAQVGLLVALIVPALVSSVHAQLPGRSQSSRLPYPHTQRKQVSGTTDRCVTRESKSNLIT